MIGEGRGDMAEGGAQVLKTMGAPRGNENRRFRLIFELYSKYSGKLLSAFKQ